MRTIVTGLRAHSGNLCGLQWVGRAAMLFLVIDTALAQETMPAPASPILPSVTGANTLLAAASTRIPLEDKLEQQAKKAIAEHPLQSILKTTTEGIARFDSEVKDYSCTLVKRERLNGRLQTTQIIEVKIRHKPFSVYLKFLGPKSMKGRECLYVEGQNNDKLIAHEGQGFLSRLPSIKLDPLGDLAMRGQRYAITEIGIRRLAERIQITANSDSKYQECEVKIIPDVKLDDRDTYCVQVTHPVQRDHFTFHIGQVFIDKKLSIPVRYAGYMWPKKPGKEPVLDEEYTYLRLEINNHFTDEDFDPKNRKYDF